MIAALLGLLTAAASGGERRVAQELRNRLGVDSERAPADLRAQLVRLSGQGPTGPRAAAFVGLVVSFAAPHMPQVFARPGEWELGPGHRPWPRTGVSTPYDEVLVWIGQAFSRALRAMDAQGRVPEAVVRQWQGVWPAEYQATWPDDTVIAQSVAGHLIRWRDWLRDAREAAQGSQEAAPHLPAMSPAEVVRAVRAFALSHVGPVAFGGAVSRGIEVVAWPDGWVVDRLVTARQLEEEGASMSHCVAGYWAEGSSGAGGVRDDAIAIFSLRGPDRVPRITWEVDRDNGRILQEHGPSDGELEAQPLEVQWRVQDAQTLLRDGPGPVAPRGRRWVAPPHATAVLTPVAWQDALSDRQMRMLEDMRWNDLSEALRDLLEQWQLHGAPRSLPARGSNPLTVLHVRDGGGFWELPVGHIANQVHDLIVGHLLRMGGFSPREFVLISRDHGRLVLDMRIDINEIVVGRPPARVGWLTLVVGDEHGWSFYAAEDPVLRPDTRSARPFDALRKGGLLVEGQAWAELQATWKLAWLDHLEEISRSGARAHFTPAEANAPRTELLQRAVARWGAPFPP